MIARKLPLEIIQMILRHVDRKDLQKILFLCKEWHRLVKPIYFEEVRWQTKDKIYYLMRHLAAINDEDDETQPFEPLPMTKRLIIRNEVEYNSDYLEEYSYKSPGTRFLVREFLQLLSFFPNLKYLDLSESVHLDYYMQVLSIDLSKELPLLLEEIVTKRELATEEEFGDEDREDEDREYDELDPRWLRFVGRYRFRHSLKRMSIYYSNNLKNGKSFMKCLQGFNSLNTLQLINEVNPDITLFHLLEALPFLSSLSYTSNFPIPTDATRQLKSLLQTLEKQKSSTTQLFRNLKKLDLSMPSLTVPYIDFVTKHRPKSLNNVGIQLTEIGMFSWISNVTTDVALDFCKSLASLTSVYLGFDVEQNENLKKIDAFY